MYEYELVGAVPLIKLENQNTAVSPVRVCFASLVQCLSALSQILSSTHVDNLFFADKPTGCLPETNSRHSGWRTKLTTWHLAKSHIFVCCLCI